MLDISELLHDIRTAETNRLQTEAKVKTQRENEIKKNAEIAAQPWIDRHLVSVLTKMREEGVTRMFVTDGMYEGVVPSREQVKIIASALNTLYNIPATFSTEGSDWNGWSDGIWITIP